MPYTLTDFPDAIKGLPAHGKEIWISAYNSAFEQYEGNEQKSAATAWTAVKTKYKQDAEGNWTAKESLPGDLSAENKRQLLQTALTAEYQLTVDTPIPSGVYIEDIFEDEVIYNVNQQIYKASFKVEDGTVTFGEPEKVVRQTVYKPIEALQVTYSEIIQEAGKRNATLDATRVKKILELCQELLSSEEPDEKVVTKAAKEATAVLSWLKEQEAMKTEGGHKYPIEAYAYAPNKFKPGSWSLRMWEDLDQKVTKAQLGRAAAALSPGGLSGVKTKVSAAELPGVKRTLRAAYRKLGIETKDMPKWIVEAESRELLLSYTPLTEAKFDKGRATIIIIKPGFNATEDRYYPAEVLKRDYGIFEGVKMYADHPTEEEDKARPERSIKDWVATLSEVTCDENGVVSGIAEIVEPWMMQKLAALRDKDMLSEMGTSINAIGSASKGNIDGKDTLVIEKLVTARSVDFVTEPGAGGIVTFYEADRHHDIDLVELPALKEHRPDLVKAIEDGVRAEVIREVRKMSDQEDRIKVLEGEIETLTTERDGLKEATEKAVKDKAIAEAQATIKEAVDKAELPDAAKDRLLERFKSAESAEGIEEAITAERDYIAKLSEAGKVKGLGATKSDPEKDKEALKESFKKMHPEWDEKQLETAVTGR